MDIVEIKRGLEISLARAGEEIETTVLTEDVVSLLHYGRDRCHDHDLVVAGSSGYLTQEGSRILHRASVDITEIDSP